MSVPLASVRALAASGHSIPGATLPPTPSLPRWRAYDFDNSQVPRPARATRRLRQP